MATNKNKSIAVKLSLSTAGLQRGIRSAKGQLRRFAADVQGMSKAVAIGAATMGAAIGSKIVKEFVDFEFAMSKVKAISGATESEFKSLRKEALRLGSVTQLTAVQIAELQLTLSKLGFKSDEINNMTDSIASLSIAMDEDLNQTGLALATTMKTYNMEADKAVSVVDILGSTFSNSALDLSKYTDAMKYVGAVAEQSGVSLTRLTAMMGVLADRGIASSTMGTAMRTMFIRSAKAGMSYTQALEELNKAQDKTTAAFDAFGKVAVPTTIILAENEDAIRELEWMASRAGGTINKMRDIMEATSRGAYKRLESAVSTLSIKVGELIQNYLTPFINKLITIANTIDTKTVASIIEFIAKLAGGSGLVWALGLVVGKVGRIIKLFGSLARVTISLVGALAGLSAPLLLVVGVIMAIAYYMARNWGPVEDRLISFANAWIDLYNESKAVREGIALIVFLFKTGWNAVIAGTDYVLENFRLMADVIGAFATGGWSEIPDIISKSLDKMSGYMVTFAESTLDDYNEMAKEIAGVVIKPHIEKKAITTFFNDTLDDVKKFIGKFTGIWTDIVPTGPPPRTTRDPVQPLYNKSKGWDNKNIKPLDTKLIPAHKIYVEYQTNWSIFAEDVSNAMNKFVDEWSTAINAVGDIFGSLFEYVNRGYEEQMDVINRATKTELDANDKAALSTRDREARRVKIQEESDKKIAAIKLKQWKAEKQASISQIVIQGALAVAKAWGQLGVVGGAVGAVLTTAAVAAQLAVAVSQKPPQFAQGGIVSGRTIAEVGEYSGVKSNPEVIAPLDKLKNMLGGIGSTAQRIYGEFKIKGSDLIYVIDTQREREKRF